MSIKRLAAAAAMLSASAVANQQTLDCPLRQIGLDYAMTLQPWRPIEAFQEVADALNGAEEAQNCSVAPNAALLHAGVKSLGLRGGSGKASSRMATYPLPKTGLVVFADPNPARGDDIKGDGSAARPYLSLQRAVQAVREQRSKAGVIVDELSPAFNPRALPQATLVLRQGTFHLPTTGGTLELTPKDSMISFQAYPSEEVFISGGVPITGQSVIRTGHHLLLCLATSIGSLEVLPAACPRPRPMTMTTPGAHRRSPICFCCCRRHVDGCRCTSSFPVRVPPGQPGRGLRRCTRWRVRFPRRRADDVHIHPHLRRLPDQRKRPQPERTRAGEARTVMAIQHTSRF